MEAAAAELAASVRQLFVGFDGGSGGRPGKREASVSPRSPVLEPSLRPFSSLHDIHEEEAAAVDEAEVPATEMFKSEEWSEPGGSVDPSKLILDMLRGGGGWGHGNDGGEGAALLSMLLADTFKATQTQNEPPHRLIRLAPTAIHVTRRVPLKWAV